MQVASGARCPLLYFSLLLIGIATLPIHGQPAPVKKDAGPPPALRLPSGAIVVVARDAESLDRPDAIYLSPEKYREMSEQIDAFRKLLAADKPLPPSSCELEGQVEKRGTHSVARVKAHFKFRAATARSVIFLGCQKAQLVEARMENRKLPLLSVSDKGLFLAVDAAGEQSIALVLDLPLLPRGGEVGFELGLPGSPITTLSFDVPAKVKRVTLTRREAAETMPDVRRVDAERLAPAKGGEALGAVTSLALSWEEAGPAALAPATRTAEADIQVQVNEADIATDARLKLKGSGREWRFIAPSNAEVAVGRTPTAASAGKLVAFAPDQAPEVVRPEPGKSEWRVRFPEAQAADLHVVIATRQPRIRSADQKQKSIVPVGPYAVLDVTRQEGTIRIRHVPQVRVTGILKGDTQRLDTGEDPGADALFRFQSLPAGAKDQVFAPLELDIRTAVGVVQTRIRHTLQWGDGGWRLRSEITALPIRSEVEHLELEVPSPGVFEASSPKLVEGIVPVRDVSPTRRIVQIKLAAPQRNEFSLVLEGQYPVVLGAQEATLALPRLLNVFDRAGEVSVVIPEGFDVRGSVFQWETDKPGTRPFPLEADAERKETLSATVVRSPASVELAWRPTRTDLSVATTTEVILGDVQAQVTQQIHVSSTGRPFRKVRLRGPTGVPDPTVTPGTLDPLGPGDFQVTLPADTREVTLSLVWSVALPTRVDETGVLNLPLYWPEEASSAENRLRVLRDRDAMTRLMPQLEPCGWQEQPIELLATESTLLTAKSYGTGVPLALRLRGSDAGDSRVRIDRALIQVQTDDAGQRYRVRYFISRWSARQLDLDMPANVSEVEVRINGIAIDARDLAGEVGMARALRIPLPASRDRQPLAIELRYRLAGANGGSLGRLLTRWQPPVPRGRGVTSTRWQIVLPARSVALTTGPGTVEERWGLRNGMMQPNPAYSSAELDRWIARGQEPTESDSTEHGWEMAADGMIVQQPIPAEFGAILIPRTLFLIAVSLAVIALGLVLSRASARVAGVCLSLIAAALVVLATVLPQPLGQLVVAAQPGLLILLVVLVVQRLVQWRYRRRLARMPGFTRMHAESALLRSNGKRPVRETLTADTPAGG